jgi:cytochrome c oxidase subunit III
VTTLGERSPTTAVRRPEALAVETPRGRPTGEWGMYLFVATEATFFACLLVSYFYVRFTIGGNWPPGSIEKPKLLKPLIMTGLLLASSVPLIWGDWAIRRGKARQLKAAVPISIVLGLAFLGLQGSEYSEKLSKFTWTTNAYGSFFYFITGFHGFHVIVGLIMLTWMWIAALLGKFTGGRHERVRMVSIYWHFVDVVWIFIVSSLYLSPHIGG